MINKQTLHIKVPQTVSNSMASFVAFFSDLHKLIKDKKDLTDAEKVISFEIYLKEGYFDYRIILSKNLSPILIPLIYTKFHDAEIKQNAVDSTFGKTQIINEFGLKRSKFFPLKTEISPDNDPYVLMAAILSNLDHFKEGIILQITLRPFSESWWQQFIRENFFFVMGTLNSIRIFLAKPFLEADFIDYYQEVKRKYEPKLFLASLRVLVYGEEKANLVEKLRLMQKVLAKLDNDDINSLQLIKTDKNDLEEKFTQRLLSTKAMILNTQEIAALYHFPDKDLDISNIDHVSSKRLEPPRNLPKGKFLENPQLSSFGLTNFRDQNISFGIKNNDRNRHLYIIGKTGMGKSKLIELLAITDIYQNKGLCVIDPHGDLASEILKYVPQRRINEVIYFNPADNDYPIGFNPLACQTPEAKHQVVTGFIAIFQKMFAHNWTNRLEHMLRFTVLALVEAGEATIIDIVRLLTEVEFRQNIIAKLEDPVVKNFWTHEFATWNEKFDNEAIIPIINQVGQFIANEYIRNVVGQTETAFDFQTAMQEGKILIINIAKGKLGEENTALLGSMIITKIQEATMARVNLPEKERKEFYLYVDEFQHFATEAFNQILSEARKFNLSLTIAHQYLNQLTESIRKTVFGNIGSFVSFRVGPEDARFLSKEFTPGVKGEDLINLGLRDIYVKLSIDGKTTKPFSASTLNVPPPDQDFSQEIIDQSRKKYGKSREEILKQFQSQKQTMQKISQLEETEDMEFEEPIV